MKGQRVPGWMLYSALVPSFTMALVSFFRHRGNLPSAWASVWPVWRPMILQSLLVVAGGIVVAAIAFGITAWRSADHA